MGNLELINDLIGKMNALPYGDEASLADILRQAEGLIREVCGVDSPHLAELRRLRFRPYSLPAAQEYAQGLWELSRERALALLQAILRTDM